MMADANEDVLPDGGYLEKLPNEVLLEIFTKSGLPIEEDLKNLRLVNKHFNALLAPCVLYHLFVNLPVQRRPLRSVVGRLQRCTRNRFDSHTKSLHIQMAPEHLSLLMTAKFSHNVHTARYAIMVRALDKLEITMQESGDGVFENKIYASNRTNDTVAYINSLVALASNVHTLHLTRFNPGNGVYGHQLLPNIEAGPNLRVLRIEHFDMLKDDLMDFLLSAKPTLRDLLLVHITLGFGHQEEETWGPTFQLLANDFALTNFTLGYPVPRGWLEPPGPMFDLFKQSFPGQAKTSNSGCLLKWSKEDGTGKGGVNRTPWLEGIIE